MIVLRVNFSHSSCLKELYIKLSTKFKGFCILNIQGPGLQYHLKIKNYFKLRISLTLSKSVLQCLPKDRKTLT